MNAIGMHTYACGFGLGLNEVGINIKKQYEVSPDSITGPRASEHRQALADSEINNSWDIHNIKNFEHQPGIQLIFGNPPCAPWSNMNTNNRNWHDDPRLNCITEIVNAGLKLESNHIIIESVVRSWTSGKEFWSGIASKLLRKNYNVYIWLHNVNALGGYQERKRFMFIASKHSLTFPEPLAIQDRPLLYDHISLMKKDSFFTSKVTYFPKSGDNHLVNFWANAKPGSLRAQGLLENPIIKTPFVAKKLDLYSPAPTIVTRYVVHPIEARCLSWSEFRHLLGFPTTWQTTRKQIKSSDVEAGILPMTRGVCPTVGRHIGRIIKSSKYDNSKKQFIVIDQR